MKLAIGIVCFAFVMGAVLVNGSLMLISPKLWFRVPSWIRLSNLPESKFSDGWGGLQIRILGAIFLFVVAWFVQGFLLKAH